MKCGSKRKSYGIEDDGDARLQEGRPPKRRKVIEQEELGGDEQELQMSHNNDNASDNDSGNDPSSTYAILQRAQHSNMLFLRNGSSVSSSNRVRFATFVRKRNIDHNDNQNITNMRTTDTKGYIAGRSKHNLRIPRR